MPANSNPMPRKTVTAVLPRPVYASLIVDHSREQGIHESYLRYSLYIQGSRVYSNSRVDLTLRYAEEHNLRVVGM